MVVKSVPFTLVVLVLWLWHTNSFAYTQDQLDSIKRLGELNGIALHCKALSETQKMKRALVQTLPKRRQLGELFDQETNRSFLNFIQNQSICPASGTLTYQIDEAIRNLETHFSAD